MMFLKRFRWSGRLLESCGNLPGGMVAALLKQRMSCAGENRLVREYLSPRGESSRSHGPGAQMIESHGSARRLI